MSAVRLLLGGTNSREYFENLLQLWDYDKVIVTRGFSKWPSIDAYDAIVIKHYPTSYSDLLPYRDAGVAVFEEFDNLASMCEALKRLQPYITKPYSWSRFVPEGCKGLEVTSKGGLVGKRFSPFFMRHSSGDTLENYYQLDIKGYRQLGYTSWKQVKGEPPRNANIDSYQTFKTLYWEYFQNNPSMLYELAVLGIDRVFTDLHATSDNTQARAYAEILNQLFGFTE